MRKLSAAAVTLVCCLLLAESAWAGCTEDSSVNSYQAEVTPATDCLDVSVTGNECVGGVNVIVKNECDAVFAPAESTWMCEEDPCTEDEEIELVEVPSGGSAWNRVYEFPADTDTTHTYEATLDGDDISIDVTFNASIAKEYEGCTHTPGQPTVPWVAAVLVLLSMALVSRRPCQGEDI